MAKKGARRIPGTIAPDDFLTLASEVLVANGRSPLPPEDVGPQRRIIRVRDDDRVLQILAGPGSGKTEMLVWRVLFDLCVRGLDSRRVMLTTFTRRAATELSVRVVERTDELLKRAHARGFVARDPLVHDLRIGTIHSLCDTLLAEFDDDYMAEGTQLIDEAECAARLSRAQWNDLGYSSSGYPRRAVNRLVSSSNLTALFRAPWDDRTTWPSSTIDRVGFLSALISQHVETWYPRCHSSHIPNGIQALHGPAGLTDDLEKLRLRWEDYLHKHQVLDFTTIQKRFLESQDAFLDQIDHVFVDEFQDNNPIQFAIHTAWLRTPTTRLTVVGDDDQALYRFRGSDLKCFTDLEPFCKNAAIPFRREVIDVNHRSTSRIVKFCQAFRASSALATTSLPKTMRPADDAAKGAAVRLMIGPWTDLCTVVAEELDQLGCGRVPVPGEPVPPTAAILMFSTSEASSKSAAEPLRLEIAARQGIRIYNPRSKTAAQPGSPVHELLGLLSYLVDPITKAPVGKGGRTVEVAASMSETSKHAASLTAPPEFSVNTAHLAFQKKIVKRGGTIGAPGPEEQSILSYLDSLRAKLLVANRKRKKTGRGVRLTIAGVVARLLTFPRFRNCGYTVSLFRQALFTALLEANIAPSRRTFENLDDPIELTQSKGKVVWPSRYWSLLSFLGSYLQNAGVDDPDVEAFEDDAVLLLTFHQAKGLEFDHVYVAGTGRAPDLGPALRTLLFSGETPDYDADTAQALICKDRRVQDLATADRDREVYVAMTRAKHCLTILQDPSHNWAYLQSNPILTKLFKNRAERRHHVNKRVRVKEVTL